jgi:hypothetical protein
MSELFTNFQNIIMTSIKPQFLQIINLEIVKYVNTGDRVKDGAIVVILNSVFSIFVSIIYYIFEIIYFKIKCNTIICKGKIDTDKVLQIYNQDKVSKFKFVYHTYDSYFTSEISVGNIIDYLKVNKKLTKITPNCQTACNTTYKIFEGGKLKINTLPSEFLTNETVLKIANSDDKFTNNQQQWFLPVDSYINDYGEENYVFLFNKMLVSESVEQLGNTVLKILDFIYETGINDNLNSSKKNVLTIDEYNEDSRSLLNIGFVNPNITFDTLVLENKDTILNWLDRFQTKSIYPSGLALPNKLGVLLFGPGGTGKTGCITASANKLNKSILIINSLCLKSSEFRVIKNLINKCSKTHIIVFEEFDYILTSKNNENDYDNDEIEILKSNLFKITDENERTLTLNKIRELKKSKKSNNDIDIRNILLLLDGLEASEDRIIMATTNNPDKINHLYIRPGRFDLVVKLSYCNYNMFKEIIMKKYLNLTNEFFKENNDKIHKILSLNVTPLVLINKLVISKNELSLLDELLLLKQSEYNLEPLNN